MQGCVEMTSPLVARLEPASLPLDMAMEAEATAVFPAPPPGMVTVPGQPRRGACGHSSAPRSRLYGESRYRTENDSVE